MCFLEKEDQPHFLYRQEGQNQFSSPTEENTKASKKNVQKWAIVSAVRRLSRQAVKKHSEALDSEPWCTQKSSYWLFSSVIEEEPKEIEYDNRAER